MSTNHHSIAPVELNPPFSQQLVAKTPLETGLFLALAPMDGVTDATYRQLITEMNGGRDGVSLCVSEFIRVVHEPVQGFVILRHCPELREGGVTSTGVPVFVQLLGGDPRLLARTAQTAVELGALGIDLNFGCPAKTVNNHDGGATLLRFPKRIHSIVQAVRDAVPSDIPVSAKIRIGWDSSDDIEEISQAVAAGNASWLTIHARTRVQLYKPPVHWSAIARAKRAAPNLPIVANGDLRTPADLHACAQLSECYAFMIGRGAMGEPHIFKQIRGDFHEDFSLRKFSELLRCYAERLHSRGMSSRMTLCRVKQWLRMGSEMNPKLIPLFQKIKILTDWQDVNHLLCSKSLTC